MASSLRRVYAHLSSSLCYGCHSNSILSSSNTLSSLPFRNTSAGKLSVFKIGLGCFKAPLPPNYSSHVRTFINLPTIFAQGFQSSGRKIFRRCVLGVGVTTAILYNPSNVAYAMHDSAGELVGNSGDLKDDFNMAWALARKYQLSLVMLMMLILGWRRPFITAINALIFLFCTRPNPLSIYLFIEHLRKREMQRDPSLGKTKMLYARKIEVEDYKLVCYGQVELRDKKLHLIGLLGGWWIFHVSKI
ncbi:hypothetical protein LUZ60_009766 [Juncus effusus]|nr:hypothetical protein LUZ60_009766 [Juncus effusus]